MEDLVLKSERLAMEAATLSGRNLEMPRIKRNLSQIIEAGNKLWSRTVGASANLDASEVRASVLFGTRGYDYQKVSRNLDSLVSRALKNYRTSNQSTQPTLRETDIQGFLKNERENAIINVKEEIKEFCWKQGDNQYWHTVKQDWQKEKLELLNSISCADLEGKKIDLSADLTMPAGDYTTRTKDFDTIDYTNDLDRIRGLDVDKVSQKAEECESNGQYLDAVKFYDCASKCSKVLEILTKLLSDVLPVRENEKSEREKLEHLALKIANRYYEQQVDVPRELAGTFYLLLDLMTFFDYYHIGHYSEALDTIHKLKLLPATQAEVEAKSREFDEYPQEIRENISDILLATMNMLYSIYKVQPSMEIRQKAKALITFSGMIRYKMPSDVIARLIELEVLVN